jgi:hypothetical protein
MKGKISEDKEIKNKGNRIRSNRRKERDKYGYHAI